MIRAHTAKKGACPSLRRSSWEAPEDLAFSGANVSFPVGNSAGVCNGQPARVGVGARLAGAREAGQAAVPSDRAIMLGGPGGRSPGLEFPPGIKKGSVYPDWRKMQRS